MDFIPPQPYLTEQWMIDHIRSECKLKENQVNLKSHQINSTRLGIDLSDEKGSLILDHLKEVVYPYGEPVIDYWMKEYTTGQYAAMHVDNAYEFPNVLYATSILIESDNVEGGEYIIGSDYDFTKKKWIKHRLKYYDVKTPGLGITWAQYTYHGITEITSGVRKSFMVMKKSSMLWKDIEHA